MNAPMYLRVFIDVDFVRLGLFPKFPVIGSYHLLNQNYQYVYVQERTGQNAVLMTSGQT